MWSFCLTSLVIFTISMNSMAQGNKNCLDESWTYHRHTHTCFQYLFSPDMTNGATTKRTWADGNAGCKEFQGGPSRSKPGQLARIDDETTNNFVQNMVSSPTWKTYIGLYYNTDVNDYRWTGYPDEVPPYTKLAISQPTPIDSTPYMVITEYEWLGREESKTHPAICQLDAVTPGINLACPSLPLRVHAKPDQSITCQFLYNVWTSASISFGPSENLVGTCQDDKSCTVENAYSMEISTPADPNSVSLEFTDKVTRQEEGEWKCSVSNYNRILESKSCQIKVYEPPTDVSCHTQLSAKAITVDCTTDRNYPKAKCIWPYTSSEDNDLQQAFQLKDDVTYSHIQVTPEPDDGIFYYKSECSLTLTFDDGAKINPGNYAVQVLVYPDLAVSDSSFKKTSGYKAETFVLIESPQDPVFRYQNGTDTGPSATYQDDDAVQLQCEISQGKPGVESTSVSCDFSISQSGEKTHETTGNVHVLNTSATVDMDNKTCVCLGKHISGDTKSTSVTFQILYPASIINFTASESATFDLNDTVSLSCQAGGRPLPSVDIFKIYGQGIIEKLDLVTHQDNGRSKANFNANCTDNYVKFQCRAQNTLKGQVHDASSDVNVRVHCQPTLCSDTVQLQKRFSNTAILTLCVVAYPVPNVNDFKLEKRNGQDWEQYTLQPGDSIVLVYNSDVLEGVVVTLISVQDSDIANHRLSYLKYRDSKDMGSYFQFNVQVEPAKGESSSFPIVAVIIPVVIIVIIVVVIGVVLVMRKRRQQPGQKGGTEANQLGNTSNGRSNEETGNSNQALAVTDEKDQPTAHSVTAFGNSYQDDSRPYSNVVTVAATEETSYDPTYIKLDFSTHKNNNSDTKKAKSGDAHGKPSKSSKNKENVSKKATAKAKADQANDNVNDEPIEYAPISETATLKMKQEIETKEEEEKKKVDGNEEPVYQNS